MKKLQQLVEYNVFGVCTRLGEKMGIPIARIRVFFIYATFITFGSPVFVYLGLAFLMDLRKYLRRKRNLWYY